METQKKVTITARNNRKYDVVSAEEACRRLGLDVTFEWESYKRVMVAFNDYVCTNTMCGAGDV